MFFRYVYQSTQNVNLYNFSNQRTTKIVTVVNKQENSQEPRRLQVQKVILKLLECYLYKTNMYL